MRVTSTSSLSRLLGRLGIAIWMVLLPALLVALVFRYLVPTPAEAAGTWASGLAAFGDAHPVALGTGLFVGFAALARYWIAGIFAEPRCAPVATRGARLGSWMAVGVGAVAALVLRASVGVYRVEGSSMLPTLEPLDAVAGIRANGMRAILSKGPAGLPARGDLVVFRKPPGTSGPEFLVKRVVGLPGDHVSMSGSLPVINGQVVRSCEAGPYLYPLSDGGGVLGRVFVEFLGDRPHLAMYSLASEPWSGSYDVKPGEVFVLGDNRDNSSDSRAWDRGKGAGLPVSSIEVRVRRWLFGVGRDERVDVEHLLEPLELSVRLSGLDVSYLRDHIRECLAHPPTETIQVASHGI